MSESFYQLIYCSKNMIDDTRMETGQEIRSILDQARRNNTRDGITGALVFSDGSFAQVLEGPLAAVERTFERIQCDQRHGDVIVLSLRPASGPNFANWSMAYAGKLSDADDVRTLSTVCETAGQDGAEAVLDLLRGLIHREENWATVVA